jgi:hypothetical protein
MKCYVAHPPVAAHVSAARALAVGLWGWKRLVGRKRAWKVTTMHAAAVRSTAAAPIRKGADRLLVPPAEGRTA